MEKIDAAVSMYLFRFNMSSKKLKFIPRAKVEERQKILAEIEDNIRRDEWSAFINHVQKMAIKYPDKIKDVIKELQMELA